MSLPPPINWLQKQMTVEYNFPMPVNSTLMLFHTDNFFKDDEEMASLIRSCIFQTNSEFNDIWYEGIINESDREKVQEFIAMDDNFAEFGRAYQADGPNWVWINDTLMTVCDKIEFIDQSDEKDVRFWMLVQEYRFDEHPASGQQYNRKGRGHIIIIETKHLGNWDPSPRENLEISGPGGVFEFDLPKWIYDLGIDED